MTKKKRYNWKPSGNYITNSDLQKSINKDKYFMQEDWWLVKKINDKYMLSFLVVTHGGRDITIEIFEDDIAKLKENPQNIEKILEKYRRQYNY